MRPAAIPFLDAGEGWDDRLRSFQAIDIFVVAMEHARYFDSFGNRAVIIIRRLPALHILAMARSIAAAIGTRPHIAVGGPFIHFIAFWVKRLQKSPMFALLREIVANVSDLRCSPSDRSFHRIRRQLENARLALLSTS